VFLNNLPLVISHAEATSTHGLLVKFFLLKSAWSSLHRTCLARTSEMRTCVLCVAIPPCNCRLRNCSALLQLNRCALRSLPAPRMRIAGTKTSRSNEIAQETTVSTFKGIRTRTRTKHARQSAWPPVWPYYNRRQSPYGAPTLVAHCPADCTHSNV
jgi:hypothetical protein